MVKDAYGTNDLDKRISIYEYKCKNRDLFDHNEIKIDDLFRLDLSHDAPSDLDNSMNSSKYISPVNSKKVTHNENQSSIQN